MQEASKIREKLIEEFTKNYLEKLFYHCLKKTGSNIEAADLTQDIALQVFTALNKGAVPESFPAWVWQIAHNRYSVWAKEKRKRTNAVTFCDIMDYEIEDESKSILDGMIDSEQLSLLRRELSFIKSAYRDIVVAYYIENKSIREIATSLSLSVNAVEQRLHRTRILLKEGMNMERKFGKRSYNPEEIVYTNVCTAPGELGQPWTLVDPKLNQNIFLACYDNPMTVEALAIEIGVALPYTEDTVNHLTKETLLIKKGEKYETCFPIISREAQRKIHIYYEETIPRLIALITESIDRLMLQYNEAGLCYYGPYQSYEDAKWMLLPHFYKSLYAVCKSSPKIKLGNTQRKNSGVWDIIAFEKCDFIPDAVGFHSQSNGFAHYRFQHGGIQDQTPANLSHDETYELAFMVKNKNTNNADVAKKLVSYGYACRKETNFHPCIAVISQATNEAFLDFCKKEDLSPTFLKQGKRQKELQYTIFETLDQINFTVRSILFEDMPHNIRNNKRLVDALLESVCTTSHMLGYLVKHALESGWLKYDDRTSPAIGAYLSIT